VIEDFLQIEGNENTAVLTTSDHSTGGISTGRNFANLTYPKYTWHPDVLLAVNASVERIATRVKNGNGFIEI